MEEAKVIHDFRASRITDLQTRSTPEMQLFSLIQCGEGFELLHAGGGFFINGNDVRKLYDGRPLGDEHPLSILMKQRRSNGALVLYTVETEQHIGGSSAEADKLVFALQRSYPDNRIYRDPYSATTANSVSYLNGRHISPKDIVALIAGQSWGVTDHRILQNIEPDLRVLGITNVQTIEAGPIPHWTGGGGKAVFVISGHIDAKLVDFIVSLAKAGYFKDNLVILNCCQDPLTMILAGRIQSEYGARATFCFDRVVEAADVGNFIVDIAQAITISHSGVFVDLVRSNAFRIKLNGIWILCRALDADTLRAIKARDLCPFVDANT